jgi:hypothetical protein
MSVKVRSVVGGFLGIAVTVCRAVLKDPMFSHTNHRQSKVTRKLLFVTATRYAVTSTSRSRELVEYSRRKC